ncbi:MAG: hypothetical protein FJ387_16795 [Verrucomicrobia bacterium]|nr:hypothetical protein [Verrucomicrobiota bacterium]
MDLGISGLASGFDWQTFIDKMMDVERIPQRRLRADQTKIQERNNAYGSIVTQINVLRNRIETLNTASLYQGRSVGVSDTTVASASAASGATLGAYTFNFTQLATAAVRQGTAGVASPLHTSDDVSGVLVSGANFHSAVTAGTFTVNGAQVTVETSDTMQGLFDKIATATGGVVQASYSSATDKITLTGTQPVVLGSATDTSNFLRLAELHNNGTASVTSLTALGGIDRTRTLAAAPYAVAVSDGGGGAGEFKVNGVSITYNASTDTTAAVLQRINDSSAGVVATYDTLNDRLVLTNRATGDMGIAVEDVTGNFLQASGLLSGSLVRGKDLIYTVNGGDSLISQSNTVTEESSGITGLTVTALRETSTTITLTADSASVRSVIESFISDYNTLQSKIESLTQSSTNATGKVTAGTLAGERDAFDLATQLRATLYTQLSGLDTTMDHLEDLGIATNSDDNSLRVADSAKLDAALASRLNDVRQLFSNSTNGLAVQLDTYLERVVGDEGSLIARRSTLDKQSSDIDTQVSDMERLLESTRQRMVDSFIAMEQAQARINQQLQFLLQRFGSSTS